MRLYRLSFGNDLKKAFTATGAYGRWNHKGSLALYLSEHPALAALEILNYWQVYSDFRNYYLFSLEISKRDLEEASIPPTSLESSRDYGTAWLKDKSALALKVSSVVSPEAYNYVINPNHPRFELVKPALVSAFNYDERILELIKKAKK